MHGVKFLVSLFCAFEFVSRIDKDAIGFISIHVDVNVSGRDGLHGSLGAITPEGCEVDSQIFLTDVEVRQGREHHAVVVLLFAEFVLEAHNFEALTADLASVDGALTDHIVDFLMGVGVILDTGTHADDNTPGRVRGKDKHWVVNSAKLGVDCGFHLVPLMELN